MRLNDESTIDRENDFPLVDEDDELIPLSEEDDEDEDEEDEDDEEED
jgi:hypothetical protein